MKKHILLVVTICGLFRKTMAQDKIFFGTESGLSVGYINMGIRKTNVEGFQNITTFALAPTGFSLSKEWKKKWMLETGVFIHTIVNRGYGFVEEWAPGRTGLQSSYSSTNATSFRFKLLRFYHRNNKVIFSPQIGLMYSSVNQLNSIRENFQYIQTGATIINGVQVNDTMRSSVLYTNNNFLALDFGIRTWFRLTPRAFLTFDVNYYVNPNAAISFETFTYKKDGKPPVMGYTAHKARSIFLQLGFRWHWKDLHTVNQ